MHKFENGQHRPVCANHGCNGPVAYKRKNNNGWHDCRPMCNHCFRAGRGITNYRDGVTPIKKKFCENRDGRLGYVCRATNLKPHQLDLDHIDGNRENNCDANLQTLCKNCHADKSKQEGNHQGYKYSI